MEEAATLDWEGFISHYRLAYPSHRGTIPLHIDSYDISPQEASVLWSVTVSGDDPGDLIPVVQDWDACTPAVTFVRALWTGAEEEGSNG